MVFSGWQVWLYDVSPGMIGFVESNSPGLWLPLLSSATFVVFLAVFYKELDENMDALKKPILWAGAGTLCGFLIVSSLTVRQLFGGMDNPAMNPSPLLQTIFFPVLTLKIAAMLGREP